MYTMNNNAQNQSLDLSKEIAILNPKRTPLLSYLLQNGKVTKAESNIINWYEETLNTNAIKTIQEGANAPAETEDSTALLTNFTELFAGTAKVSNTAQASTIVGVDDLMAREVSKKLTLLKYKMNDILMTGTKAAKTETEGQKTNGLLNLVNDSNVITAKAANVAVDEFEAMLKIMYDSSTNDNMICFCSDVQKQVINKFYNVSFMAKDEFLGFVCDRYHTDYGDVTFVLEPSLANAKSIIVVNPDYLELKELQPAQAIDLAVTGDSIAKMVKWEGCLKLANSKAAAKIVLL
ncbi:hypothetical protein JOC70_000701 [Clostridium pascui]|uniref:SU10 major capsid protein n=1 Tax=Clostridium pascui TaxID=46609 RepID=UPI00195B32A9|nr:DUF5309 family protein [Clostridium pascui]MBM7869232.1 hypothetical protein [Clostridium pascui]